MKPKASLAIGLVALVATGCGGTSGTNNQQQVRNAFNKVVHELVDRNPAACLLFSKRYLVENTGAANYRAALAKCRAHTRRHSLSLPKGLRIDKVKVNGKKATLTASAPGQGSGRFNFVHRHGRWKLDSVTGG